MVKGKVMGLILLRLILYGISSSGAPPHYYSSDSCRAFDTYELGLCSDFKS